MTIYPAIDLKEGRCVRLQQGDPERQKIFSDDPAAMALHWVEGGAEWLHLVDLDGAFSGNPKNAEAITAITDVARKATTPIELGGGLRSVEAIGAAFASGISRAIIGTAAIENPQLVGRACRDYPGKIAIGIDAVDGLVATHGWKTVGDKA